MVINPMDFFLKRKVDLNKAHACKRLLSFVLFVSVFFLLGTKSAMATHNRAGEITYMHITGLTYEFTITTYTKTSSFDADRPILGLSYGDGVTDSVPRTVEVLLANDVKLNKYIARHTYNAPFQYIVSMGDPNRIDNIINMSSSVDVIFYLEDTVNIFDPLLFGYNNSPQLLYPPLDYGNVNVVYIHNPAAFDPDGDSLHFELIPPKAGPGTDVPGYVSPTAISPGPNNQISINPNTGEVIWDSPQQQGIYNIAILITEYRNGIKIGTMIRDLQIIVEATNNLPPDIDDKDRVCVIAGDTVDFTLNALDPNLNDDITFLASGAPLVTTISPATFTVNFGSGNPVSGRFVWATKCDHLTKNDYQVVFSAVDNFNPPLADLKTVIIKVLAPPVKNLQGLYNRNNNSVKLTWDSLYSCSSNRKFKNFSVWKKEGCDTPIDTCSPGLAQYGYTQIGTTSNYTFFDNNLIRGNEYSYRVVAEFTDRSDLGIEFNPFSGFPSDEFCIVLPLDLPFIYNVDVKETDENTGKIYIEWGKPDPVALDTIFNPGPYKFLLYRAEGIGGTNFTLINTKSGNTFSQLNDTSFTDTNLDTRNKAYTYKVGFIVNRDDTLGYSEPASSVFLTINPTDRALFLSWDFQVPWTNDSFKVFRLNDLSGLYEFLAITFAPNYKDDGLIKDSTYCYKVQSIGAYSIPGLKSPLLNFSQEVCAEPVDTLPPCPPLLTINNFCLDEELEQDVYINYLTWILDESCNDTDIVRYNIYYASTLDDPLQLIDSILDPETFNFEHNLENTLSGCYLVTAVDASGNESSKANPTCVDNCPIYELPNAFTPNGDGSNDLYVPIKPYRFVEKIELKIYNRWGNLVFETNDPDILWDGTDFKNGKALESAVFYYVCDVYFTTVNGVEKLKDPLSGYIHLFREK